MKTIRNILILVTAFISTCISKSFGQSGSHQEAMKKLSAWVGEWKGEGTMRRGPGEPQKSNVHERIEMKLDGAVLVVEGKGTYVDPTTNKEVTVHHALGLVSFDEQTNEYKFRSYLNNGKMTDAWFKVTAENHYQWGFDTPQGGKIRYSIKLDPAKKTWYESGEYSSDGTNWMNFFEMNLTKIK
jgi:hypothetical protein